MDIEEILYTFEDDYNPSSMVPGPRNMYSQGQLVRPNADGSRPGYNGKKEVLSKTKFIELITKNSDKTYNEFVEILNKDYTAAGGKPFTKGIIADRARAYDLSGTLSKKEPQGRSEESKEQRRIAENKRYYEMKKTEEGRAKQKKYRLNAKAKEYLNLGIDPPASTPQEALWKDAVTSAKKNKDGNGRFSFKSGYKKSMSRKDFFSNKIKIVDNVTGKTFNYNNYKSFINKNAKSFDINGYDDAIRPYKQKDFVNKTPGLRNSVNSALIPNYAKGNKTNAFTVQHNVGRQKNPLKVSLAFYDENTKEYYARDNFEKAWEKSKKSKTPLADRKKAFNIFKTEIDKLNVVSQPSMIKRNRSFGKELDLTEGLKIAKKKGAKIPYGTFKRLKDEINDAVGELSCGDKLAGGGRIKFSSGSSCNVRGRKILTDAVRNGINSIEPSKQNLVKRILSGSADLVRGVLDPKEFFKLKNLIGFPAAVAAAVFDTAMVADDMIRKGQPFDEAAGNELLFGQLNLQPKVQEAKRVLADSKSSLSPAAKKYAEMLVDIGEYNNTLQTKNIPMKVAGMPGDPEEQKMLQKKLDALDKKIFNTSTSGELDYLKEITERDAKDKAGSYVGEGGNEYGYTRTNALYDDPDKTDAPSFFSGQLKPSYGDLKQEPGKLPEYETKMIPAYVSQNYKTMDEQPLSKGMIDLLTKYERKKGTISADQNLDDVYFMNERFIEGPDGVSRKQKIKGLSPLEEYELQNKFGQVLSQPGMKGAQFSEGGITTLRSKYDYKK